MARTVSTLHRLAGLVLALPVVLWMGTGVLFHVKHRYAEAYEALKVPAPQADWARATVPPSQAGGAVLALFTHPSGVPAYLVARGDDARVVDAATGEELPPADTRTTRAWMEAAVKASAHAHRYGSAEQTSEDVQEHSTLAGRPLPAHRYAFRSGGKVVTVSRLTGEVTQTGALNTFIDTTYKVHYLQWTPWAPVNLTLLAVAVPLMLFLAFTGLRLAIRGRARAA